MVEEQEAIKQVAEVVEKACVNVKSLSYPDIADFKEGKNSSNPSHDEIVIPETLVRVVSKAVNRRIKIVNSVATYFDEFQEHENTMAKSLNKVSFFLISTFLLNYVDRYPYFRLVAYIMQILACV